MRPAAVLEVLEASLTLKAPRLSPFPVCNRHEILQPERLRAARNRRTHALGGRGQVSPFTLRQRGLAHCLKFFPLAPEIPKRPMRSSLGSLRPSVAATVSLLRKPGFDPWITWGVSTVAAPTPFPKVGSHFSRSEPRISLNFGRVRFSAAPTY